MKKTRCVLQHSTFSLRDRRPGIGPHLSRDDEPTRSLQEQVGAAFLPPPLAAVPASQEALSWVNR